MTAAPPHRPLAGVRIVEISSFVAVPLAGMTLSQLGAEVVRIARRPRPDEPEVHALDLTQPLGAPIDGEFDVLVHCLSPASRDEASYRAVYVDALRHLRAGLPAVSRVVFVSSTAVYGDHGGAWISSREP